MLQLVESTTSRPEPQLRSEPTPTRLSWLSGLIRLARWVQFSSVQRAVLLEAILSSFQTRIEPFLKQQIREDQCCVSTVFTFMFELRSSSRFSSANQHTAIQRLFLIRVPSEAWARDWVPKLLDRIHSSWAADLTSTNLYSEPYCSCSRTTMIFWVNLWVSCIEILILTLWDFTFVENI